jgi:putative glutamine amidotransferase
MGEGARAFVNPRILIAGPESRRLYLAPYFEAVRLMGGEPELGWPQPEALDDASALKQFLKRYQGVLLPGGPDIDPKFYGEKRRVELVEAEAGLDEGHLSLARSALEFEWPTLAICRGMQVAAVAVGAGLFQDLPTDFPSDVDHNIREPKDRLAHEVEALDGSRLAALCGSNRFPVNSRHHQAVREGPVPDRVGPFHVVAWAPDGVIEAMEHPSHHFFIAVQWHPENLVKTSAPSAALFRAFLKA